MNLKRPYVFLCTWMSLDWKLSTFERKQSEIASDDDKDILYQWRLVADAVMVWWRTLILDDPWLTVKTKERQQERLKNGKSEDPMKVAVLSNLEYIKPQWAFFERGNARKIIFTTSKSSNDKIEELRSYCDIYVCGESKVDLQESMKILYSLWVKNLMIEWGGELIYSLFKDNLVDEVNLKIGNLILWWRTSTTLCDWEWFTKETVKKLELISFEKKWNSLILKYKVNK